MKIHPRSNIATMARNELELFLVELQHRHALTYGETFSLLGNVIANLAKYQIHSERHPDDPDQKGDDA